MLPSIRRPEEILAYRPLQQILASKPKELWTVGPADSALTALQMMADKDIGLLVVLDGGGWSASCRSAIAPDGLCWPKKPLETTPVSDIMAREVVTVDFAHTFADCLRLMHQHGIRHLPVVEAAR